MLGRDDLRHVARVTISNYDRHADEFREGTKDYDVGQNVDALRSRLEGPGPFAILDLGCGPGRDLGRFRALGHEAIGLDGAARFVAMARAATGCDVWHQDFLALDLPPARFDGIFANASLFTFPRRSCLASFASSTRRSGRAASSSRRTRADPTPKVGRVSATAPGTISRRGDAT